MRVLVACEESQRVCMAFRNKGHQAFSCDLQDCSGGFPEYHIKGDCVPVIEYNSWDLIIAHPPCTYLAVSSACNLYKKGVLDYQRYEKMLKAREFFMYFYNLTGVRVCIENPRAMSLCNLPPYTQVIQPYDFGSPYSKQTLLWLKDLPYLIPNVYVPDRRNGGISWVGLKRNPKDRSKTFSEVAEAMAQQWSF